MEKNIIHSVTSSGWLLVADDRRWTLSKRSPSRHWLYI